MISRHLFGSLLLSIGLALPLAADPTPEPALTPPPGFNKIYETPDHFIAVYSNGDLEPARAEKFAGRVRAAYDFDLGREHWNDLGHLKDPLQVRVRTDMKKGLLGSAFKNVFVMSIDYIDKPLAEGTLAHELTHVQDGRQLLGHHVPHFLMEGRALLNGQAYRASLGQPPNDYDKKLKQAIANFTEEDAVEVLSEPPGKEEPPPGPLLSRLEFMGCFFVDFLRTQFHGGLSDIQPRTARMIEDVGQGMGYPEAFQKNLGASLDEAGQAFRQHIKQTAGDIQARVKGMVWQDL